jgi:hypothetical protein
MKKAGSLLLKFSCVFAICFISACISDNSHTPPETYKIPAPDLEPKMKPIKATVKGNFLNIRSAPSTEAPIKDFLHWNDSVLLLDRYVLNNDDNEAWYRLFNKPDLWVCGNFLEIDRENLINSTYGDILATLNPVENFEKNGGMWIYGSENTGCMDIKFLTKYAYNKRDCNIFFIKSYMEKDYLIGIKYPSYKILDEYSLDGEVDGLKVYRDEQNKNVYLFVETKPELRDIAENVSINEKEYLLVEFDGSEFQTINRDLMWWEVSYINKNEKNRIVGEMLIDEINDGELLAKIICYIQLENGLKLMIGDGFDLSVDIDKGVDEYNKTDFRCEDVFYEYPYGEEVDVVGDGMDKMKRVMVLPWHLPPDEEGVYWCAYSIDDEIYWKYGKSDE